jgi:glycosyltransferase involved in cell wall biosynthesis
MVKKSPLISLIVCARKGVKFIDPCFKSILSQKYKNFEVICIEGGSKGETIPKLNEYKKKDKRFKIYTGINKQPEGIGNKKWFGFKKAKGQIVGIIDLDNVLQRDDLFDEVVKIFTNKKNVVGILAGLKHDCSDEPIVRFISMFGGDPFFSYRSIDFVRNIQPELLEEDTEVYEKIKMKLDNLFLTGGNVFFYDRKTVQKIGGYDQDVMTVQRIVKNGKEDLYVIKDSTKHYAAESLRLLMKKMLVQKDRSFYEKSKEERFNYLPKTKKESHGFYKNLIFNLLILPNFVYSFKLYFKNKDPVSFSFPLVAFSTSLSHGWNYFRKNII